MNALKRISAAAAALTLASSLLVAAPYAVDSSHSNVGFKVKHLMISNVTGSFATFSGSYDVENGVLRALEGRIETASVDTGIAKRDDHLRGADFFDAAHYPEITFTMTRFEGDRVTGDLSLHGVTRSVTLDAEVSGSVKDPWGNVRTSVALSGSINRSDFGLTWNKALESGGMVVGDTIKLSVELEGIAK